MGWLEMPHWLIIAGILLVIVGLFGLVSRRKQPPEVTDEN
jgi:LPXTG-motif cell wall-anchored protein